MTEENIQKIKENVLHKIESGEVKMRPKVFFVLQVALLALLAVLAFVLSVLLISYIIFTLKAGGYYYLLGFGKRGLYHFFMVFPWFVLLLDMFFLLLFDSLLKKFKFACHSPVIYLFLGSLVLITIISSVVNFNSFHVSLLKRAEDDKLPVMGMMYQGIRRSSGRGGLYQGEVLSTEGNTFKMKLYTGKSQDGGLVVDVVFPSHASTTDFLNVGDEVFVAGQMINTEIKAYGVGKLPSDF